MSGRWSQLVVARCWIQFTGTFRNRDGIWESIDREVGITYTDQHLGGRRAWIVCPECGKRMGILYFSGPRLACRACLDLIYSSQAERYWDRAERMANRLIAKFDVGADDLIYKPKRMRWATFNKLYEEYKDLQDAASEGLCLIVARLLKRTT